MSVRLPHPRFGLDSTGPISTAAHRAAGSSFAVRYLSRYSWKVIQSQEAKNGLDLAAVFEDGARNALGGRGQGVSDASFALAQAQRLGMPAGRPIYFAVDYDTAGNASATDAYFDGCASVPSKALCGPYGGFEVTKRQLDRGFGFAWQTYAWSGGRLDARAQLYQYSNDHSFGGVGCDYDHAFFADFGQWAFQPAVDPHYIVFPADERAAVMEYDRLKPHEHFHVATIRRLRKAMLAQAAAIWTVAHQPSPPIDWQYRNRGFRFHQLRLRGLGKL